MNLILQKTINTFLTQFSSEFNFAKKNNKYFFLTQFSTIVYITSEFSFAKKMILFLTRFSTIVYITSKFNFVKKKYRNSIVILLTLSKSKNNTYFTDFEQVRN